MRAHIRHGFTKLDIRARTRRAPYAASDLAPTPRTRDSYLRWQYLRSRQAGIPARKAWAEALRKWKLAEATRRWYANSEAFYAAKIYTPHVSPRVPDQPPMYSSTRFA